MNEKPEKPPVPTREATLAQALVPIAVLVGLLASSVILFGDESSSGPNQIALMLSAGVGIIIGLLNGFSWKALEQGIVRGISLSMGAILILLVVGSLIGTWILAGIVPTMIYYGLALLVPSVFYAARVRHLRARRARDGQLLDDRRHGRRGVDRDRDGPGPEPRPRGRRHHLQAPTSGDKMSPLSDTTNLAPAMSGTNLFVHIRHMVWDHDAPVWSWPWRCSRWPASSRPAAQDAGQLDTMRQALDAQFGIGLHLLIPVAFVLVLVTSKMPAFPALLLGALAGGIFAVFFQQEGRSHVRRRDRRAQGRGAPSGVLDGAVRRVRAPFRERGARRPAVGGAGWPACYRPCGSSCRP